MIKEIKSKENSKVKHAFSLHQNKYRNEYKEFLVEGIKTIEMGIKNNLIKEVFTLGKICDFPSEIPQYIVTKEIIDKLSLMNNPEGIIAVARYPEYKEKLYKKVVYLDQINDPGNLGTIIRTALAFNYDAVILSNKSVSPFNEKVIAASKGAIFEIPVFYDEIKRYFDNQKIIVTTLSDDSISLNEISKQDKFIVVLGNESNGVSQKIIDIADYKVKINMDNIDSLNVAVAGGIILYTLA